MAVVYLQEFDAGDRGTANYDAVVERLGEVRPDGLLIHTAGFDDDAGVFRILDVWETEEQARAFMDGQLAPIIEAVMSDPADPTNAGPPTRETFYVLHDLIDP